MSVSAIAGAAAQARVAPAGRTLAVRVSLEGSKLRRTTSATFKISKSSVGARISCRLDGGTWATCGPTRTVTHLRDGRHTLFVRATAGRAVSVASAEVDVDTLPPRRPRIGNQSGGWTNAPYVTVIATAVRDAGLAGGVTYQYRTAHWAGRRCGTYGTAGAMTGRTVKVSTVGATCVEFRARDAAGNASGWSGYYVVLIDRVAPGKAVIAGADGATHPTLTLSASATDDRSGIGWYAWFYRQNGGAWIPEPEVFASSVTFSTDGTYEVKVVAYDNAGNAGVASDIGTFTIDTTIPTGD
jgi:hypothetical protein